VWAQAGVVGDRICGDDFECAACDFDKETRKIAQENKKTIERGKRPTGENSDVVFWKDKLRAQPLNKRLCLHHMKGRIDYKSCTNDYNCGNCSFDQYFFDQYAVHTVLKPVDILDVSGIKAPQGYYFHEGHTWLKVEEDSEVRIGIDDFAFHVLGFPDCVETPLMGKEVTRGQESVVLRRGENVATFSSPVSGVITAVNPDLRERGEWALSPYSDGWVMRVHATDLRQDLKRLMIGSEAKELINEDLALLMELIENETRPLAADGGNLLRDVFGNVPEIGWERLVQLLFRR
jgi:glycine cleavage system H lipoate-binding protein